MIVIVAYIVNIVDLHWFSDTSYKSGTYLSCKYFQNQITLNKSMPLNLATYLRIRNHVDKYVITKHYHQLMPLILNLLLIAVASYSLVPLASLVHMDIKAFPSRPSVLLLITNAYL
ncbi:hypothetical protein T07_8560 [Trichinella nelsoni]|uniref:Uncharacterized protein n=1 Tax=Trichinella nelsoni TaxID=6336 RepID=A0A0V0SET3_9BILA|nr:hypothetical protein T07_8560 [Trichinella nelsoni]